MIGALLRLLDRVLTAWVAFRHGNALSDMVRDAYRENDTLRSALEAAPRGLGENELGFSDWEDDYGNWYWGQRRAALKEEE